VQTGWWLLLFNELTLMVQKQTEDIFIQCVTVDEAHLLHHAILVLIIIIIIVFGCWSPGVVVSPARCSFCNIWNPGTYVLDLKNNSDDDGDNDDDDGDNDDDGDDNDDDGDDNDDHFFSREH